LGRTIIQGASFCVGAAHQVRSTHCARPIAWADWLIGGVDDWPNQSGRLRALTIAAVALWGDYFDDSDR